MTVRPGRCSTVPDKALRTRNSGIWSILKGTQCRLKHGEEKRGRTRILSLGWFSICVWDRKQGKTWEKTHRSLRVGSCKSCPGRIINKRKALHVIFLSTLCAGRRTPSWLSSQPRDGRKGFLFLSTEPVKICHAFAFRHAAPVQPITPHLLQFCRNTSMEFCRNTLMGGLIRLDPCTSDPTDAHSLCPGYLTTLHASKVLNQSPRFWFRRPTFRKARRRVASSAAAL